MAELELLWRVDHLVYACAGLEQGVAEGGGYRPFATNALVSRAFCGQRGQTIPTVVSLE